MKTTSVNGVQLAFEQWGEGDDPVVLIHGWMTSSQVWKGWRDGLDEHRHRWLMPDLRGAGRSEKPPHGYTLEAYVEDILQLLDHVGWDKVTVVGHSMGGQIAQMFAAKHPSRVTKMLLVAPVPLGGVPLPDEIVGMFSQSGENPDVQGQILDMACKTLSPESKALLLDAAATVPKACIQESFDTWHQGASPDLLQNISAPTLVLASDDPFLPESFLREAIADKVDRGTTAYLPGPGHYIQVEAPQASLAVLKAFLAT